MPQRNLGVELLQKLLKGELATRRRKNVVQARSFAKMREQTIRRYQNRAIEAAQVIEDLIALAKEMREAGARIIVGSDAGNWSVVPWQFHGPSTHREIELLVEAGWSPEEALEAATRLPAEMLGMEAEIGTLEVGKRADLLLVHGDPLTDPRALREIAWVVKDGVARTPAQWMK